MGFLELPMPSLRRATIWTSVCAVALGACTGAASDTGINPAARAPAAVKVAYIEDLSSDQAPGGMTAALQGAKLAFDNAALAGGLPVSVELVRLDTSGDPTTAQTLAGDIAADPAFVGTIEAPNLSAAVQVAANDVLSAADVPTITLSPLGALPADRGWPAWRRAVADVTQEGDSVATFVDTLGRGRGVCLLGDGTLASRAFLGAVAASSWAPVVLRARTPPGDEPGTGLTNEVARAACRAVVWGGDAGTGGLLRRSLASAGDGREIVFIGGDAMKDPMYLLVAGAAGLGTVVACPCADLSTSTQLPARRFIQDYQSEFGLPPGPYAAEAWDAARMFLRAFRGGAATRTQVQASLWSTDRYTGLANDYRFAPDGALMPGSARVRLYRDDGGRWIQLPAESTAARR
jgi:ABC-type branched-subunit amino acid transport system substrate-binding protein